MPEAEKILGAGSKEGVESASPLGLNRVNWSAKWGGATPPPQLRHHCDLQKSV